MQSPLAESVTALSRMGNFAAETALLAGDAT